MKIGETKPVTGPAAAREHASGDAVTATERTIQTPRDSVSFMGVPSEEITPQVQSAMMTLMGEIETLKRDLENSKKRLQEAESMADQDPLVPILNRRAFERELARTQSYVKRYGGNATLAYIDLDNFKHINDVHGHAAGDAVLKHVVDLVLDSVRQSDLMGRIGGDEFGIVLMQTGVENALKKVHSIIDTLRARPVSFEGKTIMLSASVGVSSVDEAEDVASAMVRADLAMYENKARADRETMLT